MISSSVSRLRRRRRSARTSGGHGHRDDGDRREPLPRLVEDGAGDVDHHAPAGREVGGDRCGDAIAEAVGPPVEGEIAVCGHFAVGGLRDGVVILAAVGDGAGDDAAGEDDGGIAGEPGAAPGDERILAGAARPDDEDKSAPPRLGARGGHGAHTTRTPSRHTARTTGT